MCNLKTLALEAARLREVAKQKHRDGIMHKFTKQFYSNQFFTLSALSDSAGIDWTHKQPEYASLQPFHCVDFHDMAPGIKEELRCVMTNLAHRYLGEPECVTVSIAVKTVFKPASTPWWKKFV